MTTTVPTQTEPTMTRAEPVPTHPPVHAPGGLADRLNALHGTRPSAHEASLASLEHRLSEQLLTLTDVITAQQEELANLRRELATRDDVLASLTQLGAEAAAREGETTSTTLSGLVPLGEMLASLGEQVQTVSAQGEDASSRLVGLGTHVQEIASELTGLAGAVSTPAQLDHLEAQLTPQLERLDSQGATVTARVEDVGTQILGVSSHIDGLDAKLEELRAAVRDQETQQLTATDLTAALAALRSELRSDIEDAAVSIVSALLGR